MRQQLPIRIVRSAEIELAAHHMQRHSEESGRAGDIVFAPFEDFDSEAWQIKHAKRFRLAVDEPGWERLWGAFDDDRMVGHVTLSGESLASSLHRTRLGIGLERAYRRKGLGRLLMQTAITWASSEPTLSWVDLGVFAHNLGARALYESLGFQETGRVSDLFRVFGQSIDDVTMTLRLR